MSISRSLPARRPFTGLHRLAGGLCVVLFAVSAGFVLATPALDHLQDLAESRYGAQGARRVGDWQRVLAEVQSLSAPEQLERINTLLNRQLHFDDDSAVWKQSDYWATPLETLGEGAGDCEDFAIAKYISLRLLGVPDSQLRLIYVRARIGGPRSSQSQAHMVLGYFPTPEAEPLVLDNLIGEISPASRRPDLFPVFSFNAEGLWVGNRSTADSSARLSRWRDVLDRMRREGLQLNP
ncbi:MAG: transglutaminase-like cysteine peptidase [Gammaproteobacteria bacterium]